MNSTVARRIALSGGLFFSSAAWMSSAPALDAALDVSQYAHTAWKTREGFAKGLVSAIAQTSDGYLWLGTQFGVWRFDGIRALPWQPPGGDRLPEGQVLALLAARDGALWVSAERGLASWDGHKLTQYSGFESDAVVSLLEDRDGTIWAGIVSLPTLKAKLCAVRNGALKCEADDGRFGRGGIKLYQDSKGALWVAVARALWRWKPGPPERLSLPGEVAGRRWVTEDSDGALLVATLEGLVRIKGGNVEPFSFDAIRAGARPNNLLADRDGALWVGTTEGLLHVHHGRTDVFSQPDGLSGNLLADLFEDREGNIWVGTSNGLDRFREFVAPTLSVRQGLYNHAASVFAGRDGSVWISTIDGLHRWNQGRITLFRGLRDALPRQHPTEATRSTAVQQIVVSGLPDEAASLFEDHRGRLWIGSRRQLGYLEQGRFVSLPGVASGAIDGITEDVSGHVWIAHRDLGLLRWTGQGDVEEEIAWSKLRGKDHALRVAADPSRGELWLGFAQGGIAHFANGQIRESFGVADGLGRGRVNDLHVAPQGAVWVATQAGLSYVKNGRIVTLTGANGLPCDTVDAIVEETDAYWLYMACGLARIARHDLEAWAAAVDGEKAAGRFIEALVLGDSDGVRSLAFPGTYSPHAARSLDGKIWLTASDGVTVVDPHRLAQNPLPPPVHIEQIIADRQTHEPSPNLRLPPLIRDLRIDYTALSLAAPEKVQFRYRLEGRDHDWQSPGNRRQAFYADLPPGQYRFHVIASNNSGVWNDQGDTLEFSITPAYWQTNWFRALCAAAFLALLWLAYWLRVRHLAKQFNRTLEARVGERTRIARELHDTLLQSFNGLLLRFQAISNRLQPGQIKEQLDGAIDEAAEAITESRDAVQGLRASAVETNDLALALKTAGEELAASPSESGSDSGSGSDTAALSVIVEGTSRTLHPVVRDDIYRIGCEALRNAFRHAAAKRIGVELGYGERQLRLRVRDDGKGIDPKFLGDEGRAGHFGLHGMRERARLIGGRLNIWSAVDFGTEVELMIPAARAYVDAPSSVFAGFIEKLSRKVEQTDS